jgi:hypothetical protein
VVLAYSFVSGEKSVLPYPIAFVGASIFSIFTSLCMWGYKESVISHFEKNFGNRAMAEWHWYNDSEDFPGKLNLAKLVTVFVFGLMQLFAFVIQLRSF